MQVHQFREKSLILAKQLYPDLQGENLIEEAARIYTYISQNDFYNFIGLEVISRDPLAFTSFVSVSKQTGNAVAPFVPYSFQENLLRTWTNGKDSIVVHSRQMGMTTLLAYYSLWRACFTPDTYMGYVCTNSAAIDEVLRRILRIHASSLFELPTVSHYTGTSITFSNGNKIKFLTPSIYVLGKSLSQLIIDDAGSIPLDQQENLYSTMMFANHGHMIVAGTAGHDFGLFYELASDPSIYGSLTTVLPYNLHPMWTQQFEDQTRQQIGHQSYDARYGCKFYAAKF